MSQPTDPAVRPEARSAEEVEHAPKLHVPQLWTNELIDTFVQAFNSAGGTGYTRDKAAGANAFRLRVWRHFIQPLHEEQRKDELARLARMLRQQERQASEPFKDDDCHHPWDVNIPTRKAPR